GTSAIQGSELAPHHSRHGTTVCSVHSMNLSIDKRRFTDQGNTILDMLDEILVECPHCTGCARIVTLVPGKRDWFAPRRLICLHCGYSRDWAERSVTRGWKHKLAVDDYFHERLWLQAACGDEVLWAYNLKHLQLIEDYVQADLREHRRR